LSFNAPPLLLALIGSANRLCRARPRPGAKHGGSRSASGGAILDLPFLLALKAEALHFENRNSEALEAIEEAEALVEMTERRNWCAELHRLRGVFLATLGADETQNETSFSAAIRIAIEQNSISLVKRAEASYAEYRQKRNALRKACSEEL
jgi:hypothetical protein